MKIRLHIDREFDGIVVLESAPQMRTLNLPFRPEERKNRRYVPLPYMIFVIRYEKINSGVPAIVQTDRKNNLFYPGIFGRGLHVYGRLEPLSSVNDEVFFLPTDTARSGLVCTEHSFDYSSYDSLSELVKKVINIWFSLGHNIENAKFSNWHKHDLKNISSLPWFEPNGQFFGHLGPATFKLKDILRETESYGYGHKDNIKIPSGRSAKSLIDKKMVDIDNLKISFPNFNADQNCPCTDVMNIPKDAKRPFKDFCWHSKCNDSHAKEDKYRIHSHCNCGKMIPTTAQKEFFFGKKQ